MASVAFRINREEVKRFEHFTIIRDTIRYQRRRGENDRGDIVRWYAIWGTTDNPQRVLMISAEMAHLAQTNPGIEHAIRDHLARGLVDPIKPDTL